MEHLTQDRYLILQRLRDDFSYYAAHCLKIRDKGGRLVPFIFNRAQLFVHNKLEEQKKRTGKVRAVIVKSRQQGCSTLISGRYFHKSSMRPGTNVFILAHIADSTRHLFKMVGRFYDNAPEPVKPPIKVSNQRNIEFEGIGSEYSIGTAGSADVGRGTTIQCMHASECAFWPNSDELMTGVMQGVANLPDTEIIFESTANGVGNMFHSLAMAGTTEESEFITIFTPWFWSNEYYTTAPDNFQPTPEESELIELYGLNNGQIYWRRLKIQDEFRGELRLFQREYPCTLHEAFVSSGDTLLDPLLVARARKLKLTDPLAPLIIGVDPARSGDRTVLTWRQGRVVRKFQTYGTMDEMTLSGIICNAINKDNPQKVFVDVGLGYGTVDRCRELGYGDIVTGVHFGSGALQPDVYQNKRAEMYDTVRMWFEEGDVSIPDDDEFVTDLMSIPVLEPSTSRGLLGLPSKKELKKLTGLKSADCMDSLALTFAFPVMSNAARNRISRKPPEMIRKSSPLATVRNFARGSQNNTGVYKETFKFI